MFHPNWPPGLQTGTRDSFQRDLQMVFLFFRDLPHPYSFQTLPVSAGGPDVGGIVWNRFGSFSKTATTLVVLSQGLHEPSWDSSWGSFPRMGEFPLWFLLSTSLSSVAPWLTHFLVSPPGRDVKRSWTARFLHTWESWIGPRIGGVVVQLVAPSIAPPGWNCCRRIRPCSVGSVTRWPLPWPTKRHDFSSWDLDPRPTHWTPRKVFQCCEIFSFCAAPPTYHWTLCPLSEYRYVQSPIREAPSGYRPGSNLGQVGLLPVKLEPNVV